MLYALNTHCKKEKGDNKENNSAEAQMPITLTARVDAVDENPERTADTIPVLPQSNQHNTSYRACDVHTYHHARIRTLVNSVLIQLPSDHTTTHGVWVFGTPVKKNIEYTELSYQHLSKFECSQLKELYALIKCTIREDEEREKPQQTELKAFKKLVNRIKTAAPYVLQDDWNKFTIQEQYIRRILFPCIQQLPTNDNTTASTAVMKRSTTTTPAEPREKDTFVGRLTLEEAPRQLTKPSDRYAQLHTNHTMARD